MITNQAVRDDVKKMFKISIDELHPMQGNLKDLSTQNFEKLKRQILDRGFSAPFFVWKNAENKLMTLDGHQRCRALKQMRDEGYEVPLLSAVEIEARDEDDARGKLLGLASQYGNVTSDGLYELMESWKIDVDQVMSDYRMPEINMDDFKSEFFEDLDTSDADDAAPEVPKIAKSKLGDVWILGEHRLMCGDSTDVAHVDRLLAGAKIDLVFTDPPYGVSVVKKGMVGADFGVAPKGAYQPVIGDDTTDTAKRFYETCVFVGLNRFILWGGNYFTDFLPPSSSWVVWNKRGDSGIKNTYADAELAWSNLGFPVRVHGQLWNGMIREGEKSQRVHPTQKPIALAEFCLNLDKSGGVVFDGFGGSGWALIACEKLKRKCYMMELAPNYIDVILTRWATFTGKDPVREDGVTWSELTRSVP